MKTELLAAQLIGIAVLRYVVKVEPMASASVDEVVDLAAPSIRATLGRDLPQLRPSNRSVSIGWSRSSSGQATAYHSRPTVRSHRSVLIG